MTKDERVGKLRERQAARAKAAAKECEAIAAMGALIAGARAEMDRTAFRTWLAQEAHVEAGAAKRYERVAERSSELARFFPLGPAAVCALSTVPAEKLGVLETDPVVDGVRLEEMNCPKLAKAVRIIMDKPVRVVPPEARAKSAIRTLARIRDTEPAAWEALAADLATIGCKPCDDCPPTGHPLTAATADERAKELVVRLADVVARVGEVVETSGALSASARGAAIGAAKGVLLAIDRLPAMGDIATATIRAG